MHSYVVTITSVVASIDKVLVKYAYIFGIINKGCIVFINAMLLFINILIICGVFNKAFDYICFALVAL